MMIWWWRYEVHCNCQIFFCCSFIWLYLYFLCVPTIKTKYIYIKKNILKACPPFGKSDHNSILLIPAYMQKLKQEVPVTRSKWKSSDDVDATLQDCFASTDWNMFSDSSNGIEEYTNSATSFINKCINDIVPTVTHSNWHTAPTISIPSCLSLQYFCCSSLCVGGLGSVCYIWSTSPVLFGVLCEFKCSL